MHVCLLNRYFDFRGTGVTRIATEVSRELERAGHKVTKFATSGASLYAYAYQTAVRPLFALPRVGIDVYHALATLEAMWLPKNRSIATFLDLFTTTNPDRAGAGMGYSRWKLEIGRRYFAFGSRIAARCRYIVCISDKTKQDVLEHVCRDEGKIRVIRLGIRDDLKLTPRTPNARLRIGTLGQLDKRKRVDLLVHQFKASRADADLLVAGNGPDLPGLTHSADGDDRITFLGVVPDDSLSGFYNSLDLFVFPTAIEGYGLPAVEAMACGVPVVVMADSILPDEIKSRCFAMGNLTGLFNSDEAIAAVIGSNDYGEHMRFAHSHRWQECVGRYMELYRSIAEGD